MIRRVTPIAVCGAILFFALKSILTDHNVVQAKAINTNSETNSLVEYQYDKIDDISACEDREIAVYFRDVYMTYHSSEVVNEALASAKGCEIDSVDVIIYDVISKDSPVEAVQDELEAYLQYHKLDPYANYDIAEAEIDTPLLNGRVAKLAFNFIDEDMQTASYNGPIN